MTLLITSIGLLLLIGAAGIGFRFGIRIGREMAETQVIDYTNRHPLDYAFEVSDSLYPARKPLIIEVPEAEEHKLAHPYRILKENYSL
jgi:hypothetical protein